MCTISNLLLNGGDEECVFELNRKCYAKCQSLTQHIGLMKNQSVHCSLGGSMCMDDLDES